MSGPYVLLDTQDADRHPSTYRAYRQGPACPPLFPHSFLSNCRSPVDTLWCAGLYLAAATTTLVVLGYAVRVQPFWLDKVGAPPQSAEEASSPSA